MNSFTKRLKTLNDRYEQLILRKNTPDSQWNNGWYTRYHNPVVTAEHVPLDWRYDLNSQTNPFLLERLGINAALNAGAIELNGKAHLVLRLEGYDRKSFFAVAESDNGIDNFRFWSEPVVMPETDEPDTNVYDMRIVQHEDGWIYGLFCTERKDPNAPAGDMSSAIAKCGIARTKDLKQWTRLADLKCDSSQQRNVVLHPEFVDGKYALYTRPQDGFIETGAGGGIAWAITDSMENATIKEEKVIDPKVYHTIKEGKNGMGAAPIKTPHGWLHIAHGVRNCAAGLRYVLYVFMCDLQKPWLVTRRPGGYFIAPRGSERVGDVSNVVFTNGLITRDNGQVLIYYASSDTRMHVATTTLDRLIDYTLNTPEDPLTSVACVQQRLQLIHRNASVNAG